MKIFVQQVGGPKFELELVNEFVVGNEIKDMIHEIKPNTQVEDMRLVYRGNQTNDGRPIAAFMRLRMEKRSGTGTSGRAYDEMNVWNKFLSY